MSYDAPALIVSSQKGALDAIYKNAVILPS
jgi:hypothetical protein